MDFFGGRGYLSILMLPIVLEHYITIAKKDMSLTTLVNKQLYLMFPLVLMTSMFPISLFIAKAKQQECFRKAISLFSREIFRGKTVS